MAKRRVAGHKGQGQLAGWTQQITFETGGTPPGRRIPKRVFIIALC